MPAQAYALVTLFALTSVLLGWLAARIASRVGGPTSRAAYVLPVMAAFLAFYAIGHRLGLAVGPELTLFGFRVALAGDLAIGFAAALIVSVAQAGVLRVARPARRA